MMAGQGEVDAAAGSNPPARRVASIPRVANMEITPAMRQPDAVGGADGAEVPEEIEEERDGGAGGGLGLLALDRADRARGSQVSRIPPRRTEAGMINSMSNKHPPKMKKPPRVNYDINGNQLLSNDSAAGTTPRLPDVQTRSVVGANPLGRKGSARPAFKQ